MNNNNSIVTIRCMTFNHKPYIRQCLDGFVMQKTDFPFLAVVVDDASTDNEQEVLWDFINNELDASTLQKNETNDYVRVFAKHKTNLYSAFVFIFLKYNHYSIKKDRKIYFKEWEDKTKYIAACEGDDYWIDPLKLQKQVDFLDSHPDFSCVCHRYYIYVESTKEHYLAPNKYFDDPNHRDEDFFEFNNEYNLLMQWTTKTLTMVYRTEMHNAEYRNKFKYGRDVHTVYNLLKKGKGACMAFVGGVYNKNPRSVFGSKNRLERIIINRDVYKEFANKENDFLLLETYNIFNDKYKLSTLNSCSLFFFKIKRRARLFLTKNKRKKLYGRISPNV